MLNTRLKTLVFAGLLGVGTFVLSSSIPSAQILDRVECNAPQKIISKTIYSDQTKSKLMITSNSAFLITAQGLTGEVCVYIQLNGDNAQMPGPEKVCTTMQKIDKQVIYEAERKTACKRGNIKSQSIIATINHNKQVEKPIFNVLTLSVSIS